MIATVRPPFFPLKTSVPSREKRGLTPRENADFLALGGYSRRVVNVPRTAGYTAMRSTGTYQIARSKEGFRRCSVTVPELFAAFPGDKAVLEDTPLGISGEQLVWSTRCWADENSAGTVIELSEDT